MTDKPSGWIIIPNWERYQHYNPEMRVPPWIKLHLSILHSFDFAELKPNARLTFLMLLPLFAEQRGIVRADTSYLSRLFNVKVTKLTLESLNHAGLILFSASKPLALGASRTLASRRSLEVEVEVEKNRTDTVSVGSVREPTVSVPVAALDTNPLEPEQDVSLSDEEADALLASQGNGHPPSADVDEATLAIIERLGQGIGRDF